VAKGTEYAGVQSLHGKRIATSYPNIVRSFFEAQGVEADLHQISGSVEIAPSIGLADAIVDLVSSGSTLMSNGLVEVETILKSEAVLVGKPDLEPGKKAMLGRLLFRMDAVQTASDNKYILLNAPENKIQDIVAVLPGLKSPTVLPLAEPGWVSLHTVIDENEFWDKIDLLRVMGAEGILVIPIEKMIR
jgi:ATP phosphoribosyltransferase